MTIVRTGTVTWVSNSKRVHLSTDHPTRVEVKRTTKFYRRVSPRYLRVIEVVSFPREN